ncbi:Fatty acyl-CoA reductase [Zostera marina]|uniref:Fatty acyl-CoA reductase n=1 Tax=Zostera marina TaxID=29655 RepID=A0A0K9NZN1_ZOSMR|nr:Fatty acyl-CoA reductase [Zostera marina]
MDLSGGVAESLKNKCILITGSTGFLGKIFVEKILRVQPDVKRIYLVIRAPDSSGAARRFHTEVRDKELFCVLRKIHGKGFEAFMEDKVLAVAGNIMENNLGIKDMNLLDTMVANVNIVVNAAATTNFIERYDVALGTNVLGPKYSMKFAKKCSNLELFMHVSTAYVAGSKEGMLLETKFEMGETLNDGNSNASYLDIDAELNLMKDTMQYLHSNSESKSEIKSMMQSLGMERAKRYGWPNTYVFTKAMGEMVLGDMRGDMPLVIIRPTIITSVYKDPLPGWMEGIRTIDSAIVSYSMGTLECFLVDVDIAMDIIPGDMVSNAMITSIAAHSNNPSQTIYHLSSSVRNPVNYSVLLDSCFRFFNAYPRHTKDGTIIKVKKIYKLDTMAKFRTYMRLKYKIPLEGLGIVNMIFCQFFADKYKELSKKYKYVMQLAELYEPFTFFKGVFDDMNVEKLRLGLNANNNISEAEMLGFDCKHMDWSRYMLDVHIPGLLKYVCKN